MSSFAHRVLVLFAHPALEASRINRRLIAAPQQIEGITFHDLYQEYPDFDVDCEAEQSLLTDHDVVIFQHPFYWYSAPPLVKQWQDLVLEHGWAYGNDGTALQDKLTLHVITAGGPEAAYTRAGGNHYTLAELLRPFEATATLCGMDFLPPFVVHGTHSLGGETLERHVADYRRLLLALRDGTLDRERARQVSRLNADLDALLDDAPGSSMKEARTGGNE